jgi:hypothetical protein
MGVIERRPSDYPDVRDTEGVIAVTRQRPRLRVVLAIVSFAVMAGCAGRTRHPDPEPGERRSFRAASVQTELFIVGAFEGIVEVWRDSLIVFVTSGRIDVRRPLEGDVLLRVALARGDTAGRWGVGDASDATPVSTIRRDGAGSLVDTLRFLVKRSSRPLHDQWLAFVFEVPRSERAADGRPLLHTAFAHSQRDVFRAPSRVGDAQP